jgi:membrane associated rhomboid family serine protease
MKKDSATLRQAILSSFLFIAILWLIKATEFFMGLSLHTLGVRPQDGDALLGIITAPMIHGSWQHLISNTLPLLLLGSLLLYGYPRVRWRSILIIWLVSGLGVWLFARPSWHYGASGLTHGLFFFLFIAGIIRRDARSIALLMIAFFMYGGMLLTIFPSEPGISYEYHFFGAFSGTLCALMFAHIERKPKQKRYSWQDADGNDLPEADDPFIGDEWKTEEQRAAEIRESNVRSVSDWRP